MDSNQVELGYWPIKGLGEISRWVLAYTGTPYNEFNGGEDWQDVKPTLGLDFPNLPFLKHGDFNVTESTAIPGYIAQTFGKPELLGNTPKEQAQVLQVCGVLKDIRNIYFKGVFIPECHKEKLEEIHKDTNLHYKLGLLEKFLGGKDYFTGSVTLADFEIAYSVYYFKVYADSFEMDSILTNYPGLTGLWDRVTALEGIKQHLTSEKWKRPLHTPSYINFVLKE